MIISTDEVSNTIQPLVVIKMFCKQETLFDLKRGIEEKGPQLP